MKNIFIINAHEYYEFSPGRLNQTLVDRAVAHFEANGYTVRQSNMKDELDVDAEIEKHQWADVVLLQTPVNWMGVPWSFKRYMDFVYSAGMDGRLCAGDGRTRENPTKNYGTGGTLKGTRYMLSLTFNAPKESFDDTNEYLFAGAGVDDLMLPAHMNFKFFAMEAMPTFACHDVMKNPKIEADLERFDAHLKHYFPKV